MFSLWDYPPEAPETMKKRYGIPQKNNQIPKLQNPQDLWNDYFKQMSLEVTC